MGWQPQKVRWRIRARILLVARVLLAAAVTLVQARRKVDSCVFQAAGRLSLHGSLAAGLVSLVVTQRQRRRLVNIYDLDSCFTLLDSQSRLWRQALSLVNFLIWLKKYWSACVRQAAPSNTWNAQPCS